MTKNSMGCLLYVEEIEVRLISPVEAATWHGFHLLSEFLGTGTGTE